MEEQLTIEQLPKSIQDKLEDTIELNPVIKSLRAKLENARQKRDYVTMARMQHNIMELKRHIESEYLKQNAVYRKRVVEFKQNMSDEDQEILSINSNMVILLADMLETSVMTINEVFQRNNPAWQVDMFDNLQKLSRECADQIKWMSVETDEYYQNTFADIADSITEMVKNKVKSLLRKVYKHNDSKKRKEAV